MQTNQPHSLRIQFLRSWSIYAPGDVVAFEATRARSLIDSGIAQRRPPSPTEKPQDKSPPAKDHPKKPADSKSKSPTSETMP